MIHHGNLSCALFDGEFATIVAAFGAYAVAQFGRPAIRAAFYSRYGSMIVRPALVSARGGMSSFRIRHILLIFGLRFCS
jgi:hypothetical protein